MTTLRTLVLLAKSLVILTTGIAGAAVVDSVLSQTWHDMPISISLLNPMR